MRQGGADPYATDYSTQLSGKDLDEEEAMKDPASEGGFGA